MNLFLPLEAYYTIVSDIKTPTGKISPKQQINYFYILHRLVYYKTFYKDVYEAGVPFNTSILKELFQKGEVVTRVLRYLQLKEFIVKTSNHSQNHFSSKFKLHPSLESDNVYNLDFSKNDYSIINKLEDRNNSKPIFQKQLDILKSCFKLNEAGVSFLENKYGSLTESRHGMTFNLSDIKLIGWYYKDYFAVRPISGSRVYTNITQLNRIYRKYLSFCGRPILMTDIRNSQILLGIPVIINKMKECNDYDINNLPQDFLFFKKLCEDGNLYDYLMDKCDYQDTRDQFKKNFYKEVWFCKNGNWKTTLRNYFQNHFPTITKYIKLIKAKDYKAFPSELSKFEASIMIDFVFETMTQEGRKVLTLHDAIICNNIQDLEYAEMLISTKFASYDLKPCFKRED